MKKNRAFTLIELLVVIAIIALLIGILLPALGKARATARQLKDSTQVRGIQQAMVVWANTNGAYPLPSTFDTGADTVAGTQQAGDLYRKDTTSNIFSIMIFNSSISPEICVSPSEVSPKVAAMTTYQYSQPTSALVAAKGLWDPGFKGTPHTDETQGIPNPTTNTTGTSHQSYAHAPPVGKRRQYWTDTYSSTQPVLGNRGPTFDSGGTDVAAYPTSGRWALPVGEAADRSNTLQIHGGRTTWEGNIAYNDNHVSFETKANPDAVTYSRVSQTPKAVTDNLFVTENDEQNPADTATSILNNSNAYLRAYSVTKLTSGAMDVGMTGGLAATTSGGRWRD